MTMIWGTRRSDCKRSCLTVALAAALGGGVVLGAMPQVAVAQQATQQQQYDIPAQALGSALNQLAIQSGEEIMVQPDLVRGLQTPQLQGRYGFDQAINRLLEGSGLSWRRNERGLVTVVKSSAAAPARTRAPRASRAAEESPTVHNMAEILVKGSRSLNADIRRTIDDPQPYVVFNREDIERSGAININDFLLTKLSANTSNTPPTGTGHLAGERSSVNLRGLGEGQTLVLIDGRRAAPSYLGVPGQVNLNGLPLSAIERIEVLPTTASAIYGGSATGGVVNVILRRDYRGGEIAISHDNSFDTDSSINRVDLSFGSSLGQRTTLMVNGSYSESNLLLRGDRDFRRRGFEHVLRNDATFLTTVHASTSPNIVSASGADLVLRDGTPLNSPVTYAPVGYAGPDSDGGSALLANAGRLNTDNDRNAAAHNGGSAFGPAVRSRSLLASLRHSFHENLDVFIDVSRNELHSNQPQGTTSRFSLPAGHAFNPFQQPIFISVPNDELNTNVQQENDVDRLSIGAISRIGAEWAVSADYTWSKSTNYYFRKDGTVNLNAALNDGFNPLVDYYNIGGRTLRPYLTNVGQINGPSSVYSYNPTLRLSGPVWRLPAGNVSASFLLEQHRIEFATRFTHWYPGASNEYFYTHPHRSQDVRSAYGEVRVPIIGSGNELSWARTLDIQLAGRYDDYKVTTSGPVSVFPGQPLPEFSYSTRSTSESTGLVGIKYSPFSGITSRASYGTGFAPPDVIDLSQPVIVESFNLSAPDPRRGGTLNPFGVTYVVGGNTNLGPERSRTFSFGLIVEPDNLPGFRASIDYTRLRKTENVTALSAALLLEYEDLFPERIRRSENLATDPAGWAGPITYFDVSRMNMASARYDALDAQFKYGFEIAGDTYVELWGNGTWTLRSDQTTIDGEPSVNLRGISASSGAVTPLNFRGFYGANLERPGWSIGWATRHYSSYYVANPELASSERIISAQGSGGRVPRQVLHDFMWRLDFDGMNYGGGARAFSLSNFELSGGVRNVFNKSPEVDLSNVMQFHSHLVDPRLRTYYVQLKYSF